MYVRPGGPNKTELRGVRPIKPCDAGSVSSYASVSTIIPPTPSTSSVAPSNCLATTGDRCVKSIPATDAPLAMPIIAATTSSRPTCLSPEF